VTENAARHGAVIFLTEDDIAQATIEEIAESHDFDSVTVEKHCSLCGHDNQYEIGQKRAIAATDYCGLL
jgi:hypothetical protein